MTAPTVDPLDREDVAGPDSYQPQESVWVRRNGAWREGSVRDIGRWALLVDFQPAAGGSATDAVQPEYVMPREPADERTVS